MSWISIIGLLSVAQAGRRDELIKKTGINPDQYDMLATANSLGSGAPAPLTGSVADRASEIFRPQMKEKTALKAFGALDKQTKTLDSALARGAGARLAKNQVRGSKLGRGVERSIASGENPYGAILQIQQSMQNKLGRKPRPWEVASEVMEARAAGTLGRIGRPSKKRNRKRVFRSEALKRRPGANTNIQDLVDAAGVNV